ncbi:MAG: hypothetical protein IJA69_00375 [Clostridia bacterium]|nr:hypothetical protein [Clostridia bacterium]
MKKQFYKFLYFCFSLLFASCCFNLCFPSNQKVFADSWTNYATAPTIVETTIGNTTTKSFVIENEQNLAWLIYGLNSKNYTYNITLKNNLDMSQYTWTPIDYAFGGNFNGNGCVIKGLNCTNQPYYSGLFKYLTGGAYVHDLTISKSSFSSGVYAGALFADSGNLQSSSNLTISNITVIDCDISVTNNQSNNTLMVGGLGGYAGWNLSSTTISSIFSLNNTVSVSDPYCTSYANVGGVVGSCYSTATTTNCYTTSYIYSSACLEIYAGGIVGFSNGGTISNCANEGLINAGDYSTSNSYGGGICGLSHGIISNCVNHSNVSSYAKTVEVVNNCPADSTTLYNKSFQQVGFGSDTFSKVYRDNKAADCYDKYTTITAYAGGIVGYGTNATNYCYNTGLVSGGHQRVEIARAIRTRMDSELWGFSAVDVRHYFKSSINCQHFTSAINGLISIETTGCYAATKISPSYTFSRTAVRSGSYNETVSSSGLGYAWSGIGNIFDHIGWYEFYDCFGATISKSTATEIAYRLYSYVLVKSGGNRNGQNESYYAIDYTTPSYYYRYTTKQISSDNLSSTLGTTNFCIKNSKVYPITLFW